ncbi:hypothetical protein L3X38_032940 [Prunus dulcis]|uniref:Uncharacterized protein n=1 Tax=Prunus dulcis TaxID=3755 RepID=A0AAD4VHC5_PRUDU|nr:hypothetical protein L3X38_032940 [Prunus dulcis]
MAGSLPMNTQPQNLMNGQQRQNDICRATAVDPNHVVVEDVTKADGGPVLRQNTVASLEIQQLIRAMETSNQLNHQWLQDMAQTLATQNAQINERFDRLLGQQNGQNGNQVAPNGVSATGPQVEVQPNFLGANPPQLNPPAGVGGIILVGMRNLNNPLLGNQAIDRGAIEQMIQDMVPHARRIGRPVYQRPYPEHFDQEEFSRGFKVPDFALFLGDGLQSTVEHIG